MKRALLLLAVAGCPHPAPKSRVVLADPVASIDGDPVQAMKAELADQILTSYERDEPPDVDTGMIARDVGPARFGVGPGDVLITPDDFARVPSRWPLFLGREAPFEIRSKRLAVELSADRSAAWMSDEISWRIPTCGRTAVVPMRVTALYAHDGDRWVQVFEHLSYARAPVPDAEGLIGKAFKSATADRDLSDALSHGVARTSGFVADDATLIGPAPTDLWQGVEAQAALPTTLIAEDRRIGFVGRASELATIAYWVGNFVIDVPAHGVVPAGKVRLRGTFVFERRKHGETTRWMLVQAHVSAPIRDLDLASAVFGVSLVTPFVPSQPLSVSCD